MSVVGDDIRERRLNERRLDAELKAIILGILGLERVQNSEPQLITTDREVMSDIELMRDRLSRIYDRARGVT